MKKWFAFLFCCMFSVVFGQERELLPVPEIPDSLLAAEQDTILENFLIPEIMIGFNAEEEKYEKNMAILRGRILRVYPYAKATAENLEILNANLAKLSSKRDQNLYIKRSQKYLESEFKEKLKKLSRKDGRILLKLIHRQTGNTTFDMIKEFKSGWTAFWSNNTAKAFSLNLKSEYHPDRDLEDFYIETQLNYLFFNYRLQYAEAKPAINFNYLRTLWKAQIEADEFYPLELRE